MRIAFLQSSADQKRLQAVLELKTDRYYPSSRMMCMSVIAAPAA